MARSYRWIRIGTDENVPLNTVDEEICKFYGDPVDPKKFHWAYDATIWHFLHMCWHGGRIQEHKEQALKDVAEEMHDLIAHLLEIYDWEGWG